MVIQPSMLPKSTYGSSLRTVIEPDGWRRLRRAAGRTTGGACAWCEEVTLAGRWRTWETHEVWTFDVATKRQVLAAVVPLCRTCHLTQHVGYARREGLEADVVARIRILNGWSQIETAREITAAEHLTSRRGRTAWDLDLTRWGDHIKLPDWPELFIPANARRAAVVRTITGTP
ncbi:MAG: hypothetical protein WA988_05055 [Candidatus Nanopelagicales bacterium]